MTRTSKSGRVLLLAERPRAQAEVSDMPGAPVRRFRIARLGFDPGRSPRPTDLGAAPLSEV